MSNIEKIKAEIERLNDINKQIAKEQGCTDFIRGINAGYLDVLCFIDSLPEEGFATVNWADGDDDGLRDHYHDSTSSVCVSYRDVKDLRQRLEVVDSLPDENNPEPYNPVYDEDYLNEKIAKATKSWEGVDVDAMLAECRGYEEKPSEDLEEAAENCVWKFIDSNDPTLVPKFIPLLLSLFISGANWQKEQMMKDAVEVDVDDLNGEIYNNCIEKGMTGKDKVKIVILKDRE